MALVVYEKNMHNTPCTRVYTDLIWQTQTWVSNTMWRQEAFGTAGAETIHQSVVDSNLCEALPVAARASA
jgi:hypothetical protein